MSDEWWARARAAETARARAALAAFAAELLRRGVAPGPLRARAGSARYRTDRVGWYLRADGSLGVGPAGEYYVLDVAPSLAGRFRGVSPDPAEPPWQVGRGARDGESIELPELLRRRLAELG
ncbi:hypothetical protein [Kineococcus radiotolerans]|uniref:Uncharacterized protein n=1 Tax=Kineococcus radiotolerans (strain ATCC BAA-149 / DSM 14245 / SRS30216) TaxID=266940 RepID=A6W6T5_KINRD|nr:hypothetical protein [Kineococcus radiotolerans]ABS02524.1 conserved hypothetical protein [Kineococcus radiotolerans SRS30216 = ATCC BAA-149]